LATQKSGIEKQVSWHESRKRKMRIKLKTRAWSAAENLDTQDDMAAYLETALEDGDAAVIGATLGDIARTRSMAQIVRDTGLGS
jgi:DNA-binding phage protein